MESETFSYFLPFFSTFFLFTARDHSRDTNKSVNPLNPELNPICYLLALLGAHHFLHVSRISVKLLTFRRLMSYIYIYIYICIYMEHPFLMVLDHTQRRSTVGRTPLDEWSARRRDLYLTTHDTHNRQIPMPPVGFEPMISAGELPAAAHLLRSWVRIPRGAWIFVCCECRVLSGRGLCDELITRPEESYRLWCVVVCDLETSRAVAPCIYDIRSLRVNDLTLILLTWRQWTPNNASK